MTHFPPSMLHERRKKTLRMLGIAMSGLMVALVLVIFGFIVRSESAHDEAKCPFARKDERAVGEVLVVEEARRCVPEAEEHRWLVMRDGKAIEFARKRLHTESFEQASWSAEADENGLVVLRLSVADKEVAEFREVDAPDR